MELGTNKLGPIPYPLSSKPQKILDFSFPRDILSMSAYKLSVSPEASTKGNQARDEGTFLYGINATY